jgi:prevent-host-death family protein
MISVSIADAEGHLSELIEKARAGERVEITDGENKTPMVLLAPIEPAQNRRLGFLEDPNFVLPESFWEPLPEEELRLWNGEGE